MKRSPAEGLWWGMCAVLGIAGLSVLLLLLAAIYVLWVIGGW